MTRKALEHAETEETPCEVARKIHDALIYLWSEATRAGLSDVPDALWTAAQMAQKEAEDARMAANA